MTGGICSSVRIVFQFRPLDYGTVLQATDRTLARLYTVVVKSNFSNNRCKSSPFSPHFLLRVLRSRQPTQDLARAHPTAPPHARPAPRPTLPATPRN